MKIKKVSIEEIGVNLAAIVTLEDGRELSEWVHHHDSPLDGPRAVNEYERERTDTAESTGYWPRDLTEDQRDEIKDAMDAAIAQWARVKAIRETMRIIKETETA